MPSDFFTELLDFGALGLFAGFPVYLYIGMQKRLDALVERFQDQLNDINKDYDDRIEKMRERYDVVIKEARAEGTAAHKDLLDMRERIHGDVVAQIEENARKLDSALEKLDTGLSAMRKHYQQAEIEQRVREMAKEKE